MVTVALRRVDLDATGGPDILEFIDRSATCCCPNTSGAVDADEAVRLARLARAAGMPTWVKLEVTPEPRYLLPDPVETLRAAELLVADGFTVLPYIGADPVLAKRLEEAGCATVMPLGLVDRLEPGAADPRRGADHPGAGDGAGRGRRRARRAVARGRVHGDGVRRGAGEHGDRRGAGPGRDGPGAFRLGVEAGRRAFLAGRAPERYSAEASSPLTGFLDKLVTSQADPGVTEP